MTIIQMNNPNIIEKELSYQIMGVLFDVQNKLGSEYQEKYYQRAISQALREKNISFVEQIPVDLDFKGKNIGKYVLDFLIEKRVILEIKAVPRLKPIYFQQVRAYLKANNLELGILANFRGNRLTYKRILYPILIINSDNSNSDIFVSLAKQTVEKYIKTGKIISIPEDFPETRRAGVFVSIHKELRGLPRRQALATRGCKPREQESVLRGCIGTFSPTQDCIAQEIIHNAIESATQDPRFPPVTANELSDLVYSVDILSEPVHVMDNFISSSSTAIRYKLSAKKHGIIVATADGRRGLLLPDLDGVDTVDQQIDICRQKAWISEDEPVTLYRFTVERHQ